jgi:hypothetical protein
MTEAQRLRLLELAVQAGAAPDMTINYARQFERYLRGESAVVPVSNSTPDSGLSGI